MPKLRILLADDHETVREGLKAILNAQADMEVVGEAGDGRSAVSTARRLAPDVVVMDVSMPEVNGLRATADIVGCCPGVKVVALTRHSDHGYVQQLLKAGASGYVLKQSRTAELLFAIRAIGAGRQYLDPGVTGRVIGSLPHRQAAGGAVKISDLSPREEEVLRLVAWGYSNKEIAVRLGLSVKTIETHKANAAQKLKLRSRIDVVRFALLQGWLQDE
jgi:DNA-binding NarL/FixJ family response regulator